MRSFGLVLLVGIVALTLLGCQRGTAGGTVTTAHDVDASLVSGGLTRTYHLHLPAAYSATTTWPLVIVLHGRGGTGSGMIGLSGMNAAADQQGFIAVYPDGYSHSWADGRGTTPADQQGIDDVGFISALIDTLVAGDHADPRRVYATGLSNGGFFTERLACDLADKVAAVVPVAGTLSDTLAARCAPTRPVPLLLIEGTADPLVPFGGGQVLDDRGTVLSASGTVAHWAVLDGCSGGPTTATLPDIAHDETQVTTTTYTPCAGNSQVALDAVEGGGHTWPSGQQYLPERTIGKTTHQIDNVTIWTFLRQYSL